MGFGDYNFDIFEKSKEEDTRGMGTTLTAGMLVDDRFFYAHVGDSRGYIFRGKSIEQFTTDHSWVAEQVALGILTEEQAENHPRRNIITRAMGLDSDVEVDSGVIDLAINNNNPDELYAAYWEVRRHYFETYSGGDHSSIYRSLDAGKTWTPIHTNKGFSSLPLGKISVSFADGRLWALVQSSEKGLYKSDDKGETWELVSIEDDLTGRVALEVFVQLSQIRLQTRHRTVANAVVDICGSHQAPPLTPRQSARICLS